VSEPMIHHEGAKFSHSAGWLCDLCPTYPRNEPVAPISLAAAAAIERALASPAPVPPVAEGKA
jgi:hypothetical protein